VKEDYALPYEKKFRLEGKDMVEHGPRGVSGHPEDPTSVAKHVRSQNAVHNAIAYHRRKYGRACPVVFLAIAKSHLPLAVVCTIYKCNIMNHNEQARVAPLDFWNEDHFRVKLKEKNLAQLSAWFA